MTEMLFGKQFEVYEGEDMSDLIGDEWMEIEMNENCDCTGCTFCGCMVE